MKNALTCVVVFIVCIALFVCCGFLGIISGWTDTYITNKVDYIDQKINDATNYETKKKVEDTCRAMISSYESDRLTYEQYKDSDNKEKQSWSEQAKMRANKTAATYNNYVIKNSFVWAGNIPEDIKTKLDYVE